MKNKFKLHPYFFTFLAFLLVLGFAGVSYAFIYTSSGEISTTPGSLTPEDYSQLENEEVTVTRDKTLRVTGTTLIDADLTVTGTTTLDGPLTLGTQTTLPTHAVRADRTIAAGEGLIGGGNLTADRVLSVDYGSLPGTAVQGDTTITIDAGPGLSGGGTLTLGEGGTINTRIATTPVTPGTYGSSTEIPNFTVNDQGRLTESGSTTVDIRTLGAFVQGGNSFGEPATLGTNDNFGLRFVTDGTERGRITSSGDIGIGTSSPSVALDIDGDIRVRNLTNCDTVDTDADGNLSCGTDDGGGSAGVDSLNTLTGDLTLQGTADQISVADDGSDTLTLSTPQDIATTSSPTFSGLTVNGALSANGNTTLGDTAGDQLSINATLQGGSPLRFEGATANTNETTFAITDPTADRTITFPDVSGEVSLLGQIIENSELANDNVTYTAGTGLTGGGTVALGGSAALDIATGNGIQIASDAVALGPLTGDWNQTGAFDIVLDNTDSELRMLESGSSPEFFGTLDIADLTADRTYNFPDLAASSDEVCIKNLENCIGDGGDGSGAAPADATYVTLSLDADLSNERALDTGASLNLSDGGANANVTLNTVQDIQTSASPTFSNLTLQGGTATLGQAGTQGQLTLHDGGSTDNTGTLQVVSSLGQDTVYTIPDPSAASDEVCLVGLGNCAGSGDGVTTSGGTADRIAKFTSGQNIEDSSLIDDGATVSIDAGVDLTVDSTSLHVDATNDRVGIGTATPSQLLHVAGNALIDNDLTVSGAGAFTGTVSGADAVNNDEFVTLGQINDGSDTSTTAFVQGGNSFGTLATLGTNDANDLAFETGGTERIRIDTSGNVGIGTNNPGAQLHSTLNADMSQSVATSAGFFNIDLDASQGTTTDYATALRGRLAINTVSGSPLSELDAGYNAVEGKPVILGDGSVSSLGAVTARGTYHGGTVDSHYLFRAMLPQDQSSGTANIGTLYGYYVDDLSSSGFVGDSYGVYQEGANDDNYFAGNTGIGTVTPSNQLTVSGNADVTGNLGVGVASPSVALDVSGQGAFTGVVSGADAVNSGEFVTLGQINDGSDTSTNAFVQGGNSFGAEAVLGTNDAQKLQIKTNNSGRIYINSSGQIGLGDGPSGAQVRVKNWAGTQVAQKIVGASDQSEDMLQLLNSSGTVLSTFDASGNLGIGTTSPAQPLDVNGNINTSGALLLPNSMKVQSGAANRLGLGETGTGGHEFEIRSDGTDYANAFATVGTNVRLHSNGVSYFNGGNVGIGTAAPSYALDVQDGTGIVGQFSGRVIGGDAVNNNEFVTLGQINDGSNTSTTAFVQGGNSFGALATLGTNDANALAFETGGTERIRVDTNGNLGINTTSPTQKLTLQGGNFLSTADSSTLTDGGSLNSGDLTLQGYYDSDGTTGVTATAKAINLRNIVDTSGNERLAVINNAGTEFVTFDGADQQVGIGITNPEDDFHLFDTGDSDSIHSMTLGAYQVDNGGYIQYQGDNTLRLAVHGDTDSLVIGDNGNVGFGTTTPGNRIHIVESNDTSAFVVEATGVDSKPAFSLQGLPSTNSKAFEIKMDGESFGRAQFYANGTLGLGPGSATRDVFLRRDSANTLRVGDTIDGMQSTSGTGTLLVNRTFNVDVTENNSGGSTGVLRFGATNSGEYIRSARSGTTNVDGLDLVTSNTARLSVTSGGNVGIGTSGPSEGLTLGSDGTHRNLLLSRENTATSTTQYSSNDLMLQGSVWDETNTVAENRTITMKTIAGSGADGSEPYRLAVLNDAGTEFVTFDGANQQVGIGVTSPSERLHMDGNIAMNSSSFFIGSLASGSQLQGTGSVALGQNIDNLSPQGIAIGENVQTGNTGTGAGDRHVAIGAGASTQASTSGSRTDGIAIGTSAFTNSNDGIAIGTNSEAILGSAQGIAIGREASSRGIRSIALGFRADTGHNYSIALGRAATTTTSNQLMIGSSSYGLDIVNPYGNIGIGTTSPTEGLTLQGGNFLSTADSSTLTDGGSLNSGDLTLQGYYDSDGTTGVTTTAKAINLRNIVDTSGNERLAVINNAGTEFVTFDGANQRVGIGTTAPDKTLDVAGDIALDDQIQFYGTSFNQVQSNTDMNLQLSTLGTGDVVIETDSSEVLRATSGDQVGIGITSPSESLEVSGNIRATASLKTDANLILEDGGSTRGRLRWSSFSNNVQLQTRDSGGAITNRMTVAGEQDATQIGIGTSSPSSTLDVNGDANFRHERNGAITSNTTISRANQIVGVDSSGGAVTITLGSGMVADGAWIAVNDEGLSAGTNSITVATEGSETIDGGSSQTLSNDNQGVVLYSDGTNWFSRSEVSGGGTLDYAEYFGTYDDELEPAEIVVPDPSYEPEENGQAANNVFVKRSSEAYERGIMGIVSTNPYEAIGKTTFEPEDNPLPIGLAGRVPLKVTDENGAIEVGDYVTSSSTPGAGMRATETGPVVGRALEAHDEEGEGVIIVLIDNTYFNLATEATIQSDDGDGEYLQNGDSAWFTDLNVSGQTTLNTLTVKDDAVFEGKVTVKELEVETTLTVGGHIVSRGDQPDIGVGEAFKQNTTNQTAPAEITIDGTDTAGTVTIETGNQSGKGEVAAVTFAETFDHEKPRVLLTPGNSAAGNSNIYVRFASISGESFAIHSDQKLEPNTKYIFNYFVIESTQE